MTFQLDEASEGWAFAIESEAEENPEIEAKETRRGRPKKTTAPVSSEDVGEPLPTLSAKEVEPIVSALSNLACNSAGVTTLDEGEVTELSEAFAPVMEKYFGAAVSRYAPEVVCIGVIIKVASPRVKEYVAKAEADKESGDTPGVELREEFGGELADS